MEIRVQHTGGVRFEASTRGHRVICDQPGPTGGDAAMTPPEYLLVSLGTCVGYYAAQYLKTRALPQEGLEVHVSAEKTTAPARLAHFKVDVKVPAVGKEHEAGVLRAVNACLIKNTLLAAPEIETTVSEAVPAAV